MYYNGQIVWCLDRNIPVQVGDHLSRSQWAWRGPKNTTHFIEHIGSFQKDMLFKTALPKSVEEARKLLDERKIVPCPVMLPYDQGKRIYGPELYVLEASATHLNHLIKELKKLEGKS